MTVPITVATWDYDRVRAIQDGRVRVAGCDVNYLPMPVEEIFHRAHRHAEFEVSELALGAFIAGLAAGSGPDYVALPVFLSRLFRHSAIYIRTDRGIAGPADLKGKVVGVPAYQMAAAVWARGMLKDVYRVDAADMRWRQGGLEIPGRRDLAPLKLPEGFPLEVIAPGKTLSAMLASGEIDALISARAPSCYDARHPSVRRLLKAFDAAKTIAIAELEDLAALKLTLPWIGSESIATRRLMGDDFWPYGLRANRKTLELMCRYVYEQHLSARPVSVEELFPPSAAELPVI